MKLTFKVQAQSENPTKTVVKARNFEVIVDEPKNLGGTDEGANPVEYVLAALAGCLNVMSHVIAKEMNMPLTGVTIDLEGDLDPAKFMGKSTEARAGYQEIRVKITPDTTADSETLAKWLHAVETRCPVSDNLQNATPVSITLGE
ncbi:MAG: OsmC family protein [Firmicutes bacterium]|nr:OsmC family protein [Bacillota bacterium]